MPSSTICRGNALFMQVLAVNITPLQVNARAMSTQTFSVPGVLTNDVILDGNFDGAQVNNITLAGCWVSNADVISVAFMNISAGAVTPASGNYNFIVVRPENPTLPSNLA